VRHPLAQGQQHRARPLQVIRLATDHDRQGARLGARGAARHRRIQPGHAAKGRQLRRHLAGGGGFQAGQVHQQLAAAPPGRDALRAKHHLAHHRRVGQAQQHQVGVLAQLRRAVRQARTGRHQFGALLGAAVPHRQRVAGRQQAPAHRQPHQADAGKPQ